MYSSIFPIIAACLLQLSAQTVLRDGKDYIAAVTEFEPWDTTARNLEFYEANLPAYSAFHSIDLAVFPENGLMPDIDDAVEVPDPKDKIIPYQEEQRKPRDVLAKLSKAVAESKMYVIVNLFERVKCTKETSDCPQKGYFVYNTNVVFDRKGAVIGRYRKFNVYDEKGVDKPDKPDFTTFTTDFGVTFGVFTCFDILFKTPAIDLVTERNIKHIIFPSRWIGELPFLTALQIQDGWSYSMNVSLYASGFNGPNEGHSGSGIYEARKDKNIGMYEKYGSIILLGRFTQGKYNRNFESKKTEFTNINERYEGLKLLQDPTIPLAKNKTLDLKAGKFEDEITHNGLRCKFSLKYKKANEFSNVYTYKAVAFQGERRFGANFKHEVAYCAIVLCTNGNCAMKPEDGKYPLIFDRIRIEGDFKKTNSFQMPNTLQWLNNPNLPELLTTMPYDKFAYERKELSGSDKARVSMQLMKENTDKIITFGIFGRIFK